MNTLTKVVGFVIALFAVFAVMFLIGNTFGPDEGPATTVVDHASA